MFGFFLAVLLAVCGCLDFWVGILRVELLEKVAKLVFGGFLRVDSFLIR